MPDQADLIVFRPHPEHVGALPDDLNGTCIDLSRVAAGANMRPHTIKLSAGLHAHPTNRFEVDDALRIAEIWEVSAA